jgi:hypothetical protein
MAEVFDHSAGKLREPLLLAVLAVGLASILTRVAGGRGRHALQSLLPRLGKPEIIAEK